MNSKRKNNVGEKNVMWDWWMGILPSRDFTYCSNDWDIIYYQIEDYLIVICEFVNLFNPLFFYFIDNNNYIRKETREICKTITLPKKEGEREGLNLSNPFIH